MKFDSNFMLLESCFVRGSLPKGCTAQHFGLSGPDLSLAIGISGRCINHPGAEGING